MYYPPTGPRLKSQVFYSFIFPEYIELNDVLVMPFNFLINQNIKSWLTNFTKSKLKVLKGYEQW